MRVYLALLVTLVLLGSGVLVKASPLDGGWALRKRVPGGAVFKATETFKGGERACVIVIGDHRPVVRLQLKVEDAKGNLIVEDKHAGDFCTVIWYPPRDGEYKISVAVPSIGGEQDYNDVYIAVK